MLAPEDDVAAPAGPRAPRGAFVAVVGPSGAGKDTLIAYARERLSLDARPRVNFVRRVITRPADADFEDHDSIPDEAFERALAGGAFALAWSAHGLRYGLPASIDRQIAAGQTVVANLSRAAIADLRLRYRNVEVVLVTASPATLSARLAVRGREGEADVAARLARADTAGIEISGAVTRIVNDGPVEAAGEALVAAILRAGQRAAARADG